MQPIGVLQTTGLVTSFRILNENSGASRRTLQVFGLWLTLVIASPFTLHAEHPAAQLMHRFPAVEAGQAVAVDATHFYAITNSAIGRYDRTTGQRTAGWSATPDLPLTHLNSGIVYDGKLYCAHSNYPAAPSVSSIEVFDTTTLEHVATHSLGIEVGSLTWVCQHEEDWWAVFAHYSRPLEGRPVVQGNEYTSLVRYDSLWRRKAGWVFPKELLAKFHPDSCSGGLWAEGGKLLCTGHDAAEVYVLTLPRAGSTLVWSGTIALPELTGQGIAICPAEPALVWGINRPLREVVVHELPPPDGRLSKGP